MKTRMASRFWLLLPLLLIGAGFSSAPEPVVEAARRGDVDAVRRLIASGADVNAAGGDGMTSLHWAAERGDVEDIAKSRRS
jgi:ankyrin repeat protein